VRVSDQDNRNFIQDFEDLANALLNSNYSTFTAKLNRFLSFLDESSIANKVLQNQLPEVDFESWYEEACSTVKSMVGSGTLTWPSNSKEHITMTLALLKRIGSEEEDVPAFCRKFMYSENNFNTLVNDFNAQIVEPFCRDIFKLIQRNIDVTDNSQIQKAGAASLVSWYQKPIGLIGIGLFITIVGGLFVAKVGGLL